MTILNPGSKDIILASGSPRRKLILENEGFKVKVFQPLAVHEIALNDKSFTTPAAVVIENSLRKIKSFTEKTSCPILASDTIVVFNNKQYSKPQDLKEAAIFLEELSGKTHQVYSGFAIKVQEKTITGYDKSDVTFKNLSDKAIKKYLEKVHVLDKAGAYAIQEEKELIIQSYKGSFLNIMGLPLEKIIELLKTKGVA